MILPKAMRIAGQWASAASAPLLGSRMMRNLLLAPEIRHSDRVTSGVSAFNQRWPQDGVEASSGESKTNSTNAPIFILSAGWGTGSTLVQRLIISSGGAVVWGEPFDQTATIHRLAMSVAAIRKNWPPEYHFKDVGDSQILSDEWIANLAPSHDAFKSAHRAFFDHWLCGSDGIEGKRWGLKEVRLTIDHARYLRWLYPDSRILFVYRDIYNSYLSCRRVDWLSVWPNYKVAPILAFSHHWRYLMEGFLNGCDEIDGFMIRYEDLVSGELSIDSLEAYLGLYGMDRGLIDNKPIGARARRRSPLILPEKMVLDAVAGKLRKKLRYCDNDV